MRNDHIKIIDKLASALAEHDKLTDALADSVPKKDYERVIVALKRCQELLAMGALSATDAQAALDMRTYAGALDGFFMDMDRYPNIYNVSGGFNPTEYLKDKGVIKE